MAWLKELEKRIVYLVKSLKNKTEVREKMKIEIYFSDLSAKKQEEIIKLIGYDSNWEVFPICILELESD